MDREIMTGGSRNPVIPDWKLERFLLGELSANEMEAIRRAVEVDESVRARVDALEMSNREILQRNPPGWMAEQIRRRLATERRAPAVPRRRWWPRAVLVPASAVAVVALALFIVPGLLPTGGPIVTEVTRFKGAGPELRIHRQIDGGSEELVDGAQAAENDLLLLQYRTDREGFGCIVSIDGRGTITTHLPAEGDLAESVPPGSWHFLDFAYELDDAPYRETFILVTSPSVFELGIVTRAVATSPLATRPGRAEIPEDPSGVLDLPDVFAIKTFTLIKDTGHED
jgi:hypothetical protein